jgi:hypothetical protein
MKKNNKGMKTKKQKAIPKGMRTEFSVASADG